jgi:hypothetical protein
MPRDLECPSGGYHSIASERLIPAMADILVLCARGSVRQLADVLARARFRARMRAVRTVPRVAPVRQAAEPAKARGAPWPEPTAGAGLAMALPTRFQHGRADEALQ